MGDGKTTCGRVDCDKPARLMPVLELRVVAGGGSFDATLGFVVCDDHARALKADAFISDEGWAQLAEVGRCLKPPQAFKRRLTTVAFRPPGNDDYEILKKRWTR